MYDETLTEPRSYQSISVIAEFLNEDGSDSPRETIEANYKCVKQEILSLVASEMERIKNDAKLKGLIQESKTSKTQHARSIYIYPRYLRYRTLEYTKQ